MEMTRVYGGQSHRAHKSDSSLTNSKLNRSQSYYCPKGLCLTAVFHVFDSTVHGNCVVDTWIRHLPRYGHPGCIERRDIRTIHLPSLCGFCGHRSTMFAPPSPVLLEYDKL